MAGLHTNAGVERLENGGDMAENWKRFRDSITSYIDAYYEEASEKRKVSILMFHGGETLREVILSLPKVENEKLSELVKRVDAHFQPKVNITYQRYLFLTRKQNDEACEQFMTVLKNLAKKCEFGELTDSLVKDVFICGLRDVSLQQALLRMPDKTGEEVLEFCKTQISVLKQVENINKENKGDREEINIDLVKKENLEKKLIKKEAECKFCGYKHDYGKCPAYGKNCKKCGKINHFASVCFSKAKKVNLLDDGVEDEDWFVGALGQGRTGWYTAILKCQGVDMEMKVDTGAQCNVLSVKQYRQMNLELKNLRPVKTCIASFTGDKLSIIGQCTLACLYKEKCYNIDFMVVDLDCYNILGLKLAEELELIVRVNEILRPEQVSSIIPHQYLNLFDGKVGLIQQEINIEINSDVKPVVSPLRRVPYSLENKIKAELERMQEIGIIEPVDEPTDWVSQMVVIQKSDGSLRICLDPRALNQATKRAHYPLPTLEDISSKLSGAKHFCKLDAQSGFWMLPLSKESSRLCTFQTKWGRYAFLRLPFGLNVAPEIFHKIINETFRDISNVETFQDDILLWANSREELKITLNKVLETALKRGIKFNPSKFVFDTNEITFLGHRFSKEGITVDAEKVKAIQEIKTPTDKKSLQRVLGMFNFLSRFVEIFSEKSAPLRDLLRKDSQFRWEIHHEKSLQLLKDSISSSQVLSFYDPNQELVLSVDASSVGLGATLLQNGRPLGYASKSLTETQRRYSQIEKELLAVCFGAEKYRQYLFGKDIIKVQTDHKPLVGIFNKPLHKIPARLQRMMLRLQPYRLSISHTPGKYMYLADALSRDVKITGCDKETSFDDVEYQISMLIENLPVTKEYWKLLTDSTLKDKTLALLKTYLLQGWLSYKHLPEEIKPYYNYKDDLTVIKELVFVGNRILIPKALQYEMLKKLHTGHPGMNRMVNRSELTMFWLGINQDIKKFVKSCNTCQKFSNNNTKLELTPKPVPSIPWTEVGCDVFELYNEYYLVVVDALSNYSEVVKLTSLKSACIIERFKSIFARHGIPVKLYSDGALYFDSELFNQFAKEWGFQHILSSPHYPKSNGLAESAVKTIKLLFKKARDSNQDPHLALLNLRATPRGSLPSPAALLMGRNLRTNIPCAFSNIVPKYKIKEDRRLMIEKKLKTKMWHDRTATKRDRYEKGQDIFYKKMPDSLWEPATIVDCSEYPNSYNVMDSNSGRVYTRNEMHIKPKASSVQQQEIQNKAVTVEGGDKEGLEGEEKEDSVRTGSGRQVKPPIRFKDYVLEK